MISKSDIANKIEEIWEMLDKLAGDLYRMEEFKSEEALTKALDGCEEAINALRPY